MIKKTVTTTYTDENDFIYTFDPIEESIKVKKVTDGYEVKYLTHDENSEAPNEWDNNNLFLVNFHDSFWVEKKDIIPKHVLIKWYQGFKIDLEKRFHIFKLSCLVHGGVWLSLGESFSCDPGGWDTSHVGAVLVSRESVKLKAKARKFAEGLVDTWNQYLTNDVYCCVKETYNESKEQTDYDVVGGYYGLETALGELDSAV
jgi:hypothetical protein